MTSISDGVSRLGLGLEALLETHFCVSRSRRFQVSRLWILQRNGLLKFLNSTIFVCCICRWETTKIRRKNDRNLKKIQVRSDDDIKKKLAKCTNYEVSSLCLEFQVSSLGLGVFDEVSVSSRNFNHVLVSVSKVTVSTSSLTSIFNAIAQFQLISWKSSQCLIAFSCDYSFTPPCWGYAQAKYVIKLIL